MKHVFDSLSALNVLYGQLQEKTENIKIGSPVPASDPYLSGPSRASDTSALAKILYGRVVESVPYCHWYKVLPEGGFTPLPCCMAAGTSLASFGAKEHSVLHPNAGVYFILHPQAAYGVIIGVEPPIIYDNFTALSDYIVPGSNVGIQTEPCHNLVINLEDSGTVTDWSADRPADATSAGEWGIFAETAVGVFVDPTMAFLRADENCGVWAFYIDQLLRVSGHNLQVRTGASEWEFLDDQTEANVAMGFAAYPWESLGALAYKTKIHTERSADEIQNRAPHYCRYEPVLDDLQPFYRLYHYYGYYGNIGGKRVLCAPPRNIGSGPVSYSQQLCFPGLGCENIAPDGSYTLLSAKSLLLAKKLINPVPKQIRRQEDKAGDREDNYRFSGLLGSGRQHIVTGDIPVQGQHPSFNRVCGVLDEIAYSSNWEGLLAFHYHDKDFYLPEESEVAGEIGATNQTHIPFSSLSSKTYLDTPDPAQIYIDHRYQSVKFFPNISYLNMLEDGSVLLGDGFGSEIRMTGGSIFFTCPGDIYFQPGRRAVIMSGMDCIVRAQNCVDVSSTKGDIRVSSGDHLYHHAKGGVFIESESKYESFDKWKDRLGTDCEPSGIILKAKDANITTWSDSLYLRTGKENDPGDGIVLDSGKGEGRISVSCSSLERFIQNYAFDWFGPKSVGVGNMYSPQGTIFGSGVYVDGHFMNTGMCLVNGHILSASGHIITARADSFSGLVASLKDEDLDAAMTSIEEVRSREKDIVENGRETYDSVYEQELYQDDKKGNDEVIKEAKFSFRTQDQYKTADFYLYESRWQQMARICGQGPQTWEERLVEKSNEQTAPFPGKEKLTIEKKFFVQDLYMFDAAAGRAKDRKTGLYESPRYLQPDERIMNQSYFIVSPF